MSQDEIVDLVELISKFEADYYVKICETRLKIFDKRGGNMTGEEKARYDDLMTKEAFLKHIIDRFKRLTNYTVLLNECIEKGFLDLESKKVFKNETLRPLLIQEQRASLETFINSLKKIYGLKSIDYKIN